LSGWAIWSNDLDAGGTTLKRGSGGLGSPGFWVGRSPRVALMSLLYPDQDWPRGEW